MRTATIELFKEEMKFSAGHFTIFSQTERERLHGHNFTVYCSLRGRVDDNGLLGDYGIYKRKLFELCRSFNEYFLLPAHSPYLRIEDKGEHIDAHYGDEVIPFLAKDVKVIPVRNTTIEELSNYLVDIVTEDQALLDSGRIDEVVVKVASGPGQWGISRWERTIED